MSGSVSIDRVRIITAMVRANITTGELAERAHVGRSAVTTMRSGGRVWRTTAQRVADALNIPMEDLLDGGTGR